MKYKFKVKENGYYGGYGTDGTIAMNEEYNLNNLPTEYHYYDLSSSEPKWVLDENKKRLDEIEVELESLYTQKSELMVKIDNNELWYGEGDPEYSKYKAQYDTEKEVIKARISELNIEKETLL